MKFLSLPQELQCYIFGFLPWRDILRFTSVCKTIHKLYMSSCELQYIVELGGQQLLPFTDMDFDGHRDIPIAERLHLLRDKCHAWLQFDIHSSKSFSIPEEYHGCQTDFVNGHLILKKNDLRMKISPMLPEPSQQTVERDWSPESLCSVRDATIICSFLDLSQNLIAIAYVIADIPDETSESDYGRVHIELGALDGDGIPPNAVGQTLFPSELLPRYDNSRFRLCSKLMSSGRHIIFYHSSSSSARPISTDHSWWLQIWDWQQSTMSNCILTGSETNSYWPSCPSFCLLGSDRLLAVRDSLKLYLIEDMLQAPQLLACFLLPPTATSTLLDPWVDLFDDITYDLRPRMQARLTMWTPDPKHRLLCIYATSLELYFFVSTRVFFFEGLAAVIPWKYWGPLNTRVLRLEDNQLIRAVRRNRVLESTSTVSGTWPDSREYQLRMLDFSPLAIKRQHGSGRVVKEPSTITIPSGRKKTVLTTCLPYVEVASNRRFRHGDIAAIKFDEDRIYLSQSVNEVVPTTGDLIRVEVIDI